ncbi:MAG: hypothetical protein K8R67_04145 [Desulfobacteraceae bacterium]|nr:hypothetical protein [Desulfobacteraceae bacterium]
MIFIKCRLKTVLLLIIGGGAIIGFSEIPAVCFLSDIKVRVLLIKGLQVKSSVLLVFRAGE